MRYQQLSWSCGPGAIVCAARAVGLRLAERRVRRACGSTRKDGTDDFQMVEGIRSVGMTAEELLSGDRRAAWAFVRSSVAGGKSVVVCVDGWKHWAAVVGTIGDRALLADPTYTVRNRRENGVHSLSRSELLRRWCHSKEPGKFYGIAIGRK